MEQHGRQSGHAEWVAMSEAPCRAHGLPCLQLKSALLHRASAPVACRAHELHGLRSYVSRAPGQPWDGAAVLRGQHEGCRVQQAPGRLQPMGAAPARVGGLCAVHAEACCARRACGGLLCGAG
jgi:hypothetical protein